MLDPKDRFRKYSLRSVFNGILYIVKTGVQWRMLPSDFAPRHCPPSFGQGGRGVRIHEIQIPWAETDRFVPMPKRWIAERTFSCLENFRRLTIDYEYRADTHESMMHIAAIKLFLNKI